MSEFLEVEEEGNASLPPQPQPPRRSETLPVRFDNPIAVEFNAHPGRPRRQVYQDPRQSQTRGRYSTRERRRPMPTEGSYPDYDDDYEFYDPKKNNRRTGPDVLGDRTDKQPFTSREKDNYKDEEDIDIYVNRRADTPYISSRPDRRREYGEYSDRRPRQTRSRSPPLDRNYDSSSDHNEDDYFGSHRYRSTLRPYHEYDSSYLVPEAEKGAQRSSSLSHRVPAIIKHKTKNVRAYDDVEVGDDTSDFYANSRAYSFTLSRHGKSPQGTESIGSISGTSENGDNPEEDAANEAGPGKVCRVYRSQYVGDGVIGGHHKVQLTVMPKSAPTTGRRVTPIFKWV
jgi:hypothetical protein